MNRRDAITSLSLAGGASLLPKGRSLAEALVPKLNDAYVQAVRGTSTVKIRDIKTILTALNGIRLVVVKVETSEPGWWAGVARPSRNARRSCRRRSTSTCARS